MKINEEQTYASELVTGRWFRSMDSTAARLSVRNGRRWIIVKVPQIDWIHSDDNYSKLWIGTNCVTLRSTICRLERQLQPHGFARISRFIIVNLDRVTEFLPLPHARYQVVLSNGTRLRVTRAYVHRTRVALETGIQHNRPEMVLGLV